MTEDQKREILKVMANLNGHVRFLRDIERQLQKRMHEMEEDGRRLRELFPIEDLEADQASYTLP